MKAYKKVIVFSGSKKISEIFRHDGIELKPACLEDLSALTALEKQNFDLSGYGEHILQRHHFHHHLTGGNSMIYGCYDKDGKLVGYALWLFRKNASRVRLYSMAVDPAYRGRGLASALISNGAQLFRKWGIRALTLEVHEDHKKGRSLYQKCGFVSFARRSNYYNDHKAAILMRLEL